MAAHGMKHSKEGQLNDYVHRDYFYTLLGAVFPLSQVQVQADVCDRGCFQGFADQLLNSIAARAPDSLPVTQEYAATENAVPAALTGC